MKKRFLILTMLLISIFSFQTVSADSVVNLLPPTLTSPIVIQGVTITHVNNIYTVNGTVTDGNLLFSILDEQYIEYSTGLSNNASLLSLNGEYTATINYISGSCSDLVRFYINDNNNVSESLKLTFDGEYEELTGTFIINEGAVSIGVSLYTTGATFDNYTFSLQLEEGTVAHPYVDYFVPNANLSFVTGFIAILSAWVTGFWGVVSSSINGAVIVFYDGTNLTTLGVLALFALASGLVMFGLAFVKNLIKK